MKIGRKSRTFSCTQLNKGFALKKTYANFEIATATIVPGKSEEIKIGYLGFDYVV